MARWLPFGNLDGWYPNAAQDIIRKALRVKFEIPEFRNLLVCTFPQVLAENNVKYTGVLGYRRLMFLDLIGNNGRDTIGWGSC